MCNIIINTLYISNKILSNNYIYDIKRKLQLTANRCRNSCNTISKKSLYFKRYILKDMIIDKDLVLLNGDKDSSIVVMNRIDYNNIMQKMIDDGIKNKLDEETADNTLKDLKNSQEFLYRSYKDYEN